MLPEPDLFIAFLVATLALGLTPGPDMTYVVATSAREGLKGGLIALSGIAVGVLTHITLATVGLTAILATMPTAFTILKYLGACYLLYIAYQLLTSKDDNETIAHQGSRKGYYRIARRGILVSLTNPKVGLFFLAFLPQFIDPTKGNPALQTFLLGLIFMAIGFSIIIVAGYFAAYSAEKVARMPRLQKIFRWLAATLLGGFAVRLGLSEL